MEDHFCCFVFLSCQDEEEFPGLTLALTVNAAKLCNEVHIISCFSSQTCLHYNN